MIKISNWDDIEEYTGGGESLPIGPKFCKITDVEDVPDRSYLVVYFDIASGEFAGWYDGIEKRTGRKYGFIIRSYKETALGFFKAFITAVEKSNPGYKWDWNEKGLVGKRFGGVFGREEFMTQDGQKKFATKLMQIRSVEGLKEATVPEDKLLSPDATVVDPLMAASGPVGADGFMNIPDGLDNEQLPFM